MKYQSYAANHEVFYHISNEVFFESSRGAEILFSLAFGHSKHHGKFPYDELFPKLLGARLELALFQHHDGITGTAKDHVVVDYGRRMWRSMQDSIQVMEASANFLATKDKGNFQEKLSGVKMFSLAESRSDYDAIPVKNTIIISSSPSFVAFYNSLAQDRKQTVFLHISEPLVQVFMLLTRT